jgi:plastocyanin
VSRRLTSLVLAPIALALALTGCAGKDPGASASSTTTSSSTSPSAQSSDAAPRSASGQRIEVQVAGGQVSGDTGRVPVAAGTEVTLSVTSDVPDEVHVHGYDLEAALTPGTPAEITFDATVPGVFEVELHDAGTVLLTIQVQ